jgi:hypothetical protein
VDVFRCPTCDQVVFFHNTACLRCGTALAFEPGALTIVVDDPDRWCDARDVARCNWLTEPGRPLCPSCRLTRTRPADGDVEALAQLAVAEAAKRRLLFVLRWLGLPVEERDEDRGTGLAFDLLASSDEPVTTGHAAGVITLDLAESDVAHRERVRSDMGEPYRTLLGHFRHEVGHHYFGVLVGAADLDEARALFGDETDDYGAALERHYRDGAPDGWEDEHVSAYATMHPAEDWAETFAHYLHIRATLQTAAAYGLKADGPAYLHEVGEPLAADPSALDPSSIEGIVGTWLPLSYALNAVSRSMGVADLYPFVLPPPVIAKLGFVHRLVQASSAGGGPSGVSAAGRPTG